MAGRRVKGVEKHFNLEMEVEYGKYNNYNISNKYISEHGNTYLCCSTCCVVCLLVYMHVYRG